MLVSIASGKGGTGKTTLALMLAAARSPITLIDCDVEEPNCHLFLTSREYTQQQAVAVMIPRINADLCTGCGSCSAVCRFNAIAISGNKALLFDELCHGCAGCLLACQQGAITQNQKVIGSITSDFSTRLPGVTLISGFLNVGTPSAVPLIKTLVRHADSLPGDILFDCPPGTSCSMVSALNDSDYCILVTEPTPFGKHDLELAMNITRLLYIPTGVVINKCDNGRGDKSIEELCCGRSIPVLAKIPHSLSFACQYAAGSIPEEFQAIAAEIWNQLDLQGGQEFEGVSHCKRQRGNRENQC